MSASRRWPIDDPESPFVVPVSRRPSVFGASPPAADATGRVALTDRYKMPNAQETKISSLEAKVSSLKAKIATLDTTNGRLKAFNQDVENMNANVKADNERLKSEMVKIKCEDNKLKKDNEKFREEIHKHKERNDELIGENNNLKYKNDKLNEDNDGLKGENHKLKDKLKDKLNDKRNEDKDELKGENHKLKDKIGSLESQLSCHDNLIRSLKDEIGEKRATLNNSRNFANEVIIGLLSSGYDLPNGLPDHLIPTYENAMALSKSITKDLGPSGLFKHDYEADSSTSAALSDKGRESGKGRVRKDPLPGEPVAKKTKRHHCQQGDTQSADKDIPRSANSVVDGELPLDSSISDTAADDSDGGEV